MTRAFSKIIDNQDGSLMVMALLIMATLAIAGLLSTNDAVMESRVGRNYAIHKQCVSAAEASGKEFVQTIENVFEDSATASEAVGRLDNEDWTPFDDYNTTFDFDESQWEGTYAGRLKPSNLEGNINIPYIDSANSLAVLVDQTSSTPTYGLGASAVPDFYTYVIYCRSVHAGAGNSEAILMIGYRQKTTI
jgi:Tfp pilus assembly protein PilX